MGRPFIDNDNCIGCYLCMEVCGVDAIYIANISIGVGNEEMLHKGYNIHIDDTKCIETGLCASVCDYWAIYTVHDDDPRLPPPKPGGGGGGGGGTPFPPPPPKKECTEHINRLQDQLSYVNQNYFGIEKLRNLSSDLGVVSDLKKLQEESIIKLIKSTGGVITPVDSNLITWGKIGKSIGKVGYLAVAFDAYDTIVAISDGNSDDVWLPLGKTLLGISAIVASGPMGLVFTGVSLGIAIYDSTKTDEENRKLEQCLTN
ncbi:DUF362 domain-containing protein [Myroides sp. TSA_177.3]|uniref:DUF362 domain-containing protein n=1 Tax=Myroides sp. TSA_177.3 TaxID=3415650 RepID=UPI004045A7F7